MRSALTTIRDSHKFSECSAKSRHHTSEFRECIPSGVVILRMLYLLLCAQFIKTYSAKNDLYHQLPKMFLDSF